MAFVVNPTTDEPTHYVKLSLNSDEVALITVVGGAGGQYTPDMRGIDFEPAQQLSLRTVNSPGTKYSSFERPYAYSEQTNWQEGLGTMYAPNTPSAFYSGRDIWSSNAGQICPAGTAQIWKGVRSQDMPYWAQRDNYSGDSAVSWYAPVANTYLASSFVASATYTAAHFYMVLRKTSATYAAPTVTLCSDSGGNPGTTLATISVALVNNDFDEWVVYGTLSQALTSGTTYWIKVAFGATVGHKLGINTLRTGHTKSSVNGTVWSTYSTGDISFRLTDADVDYIWKFFEYKGGLYAIASQPDSSQAPRLFRNGWRGCADSNTGNKDRLVDAIQTGWTTEKLKNGIAVITNGPGNMDTPNYRTLVTGASGYGTVDSNWGTTHTTDTEYVIRGTDWWTEITGHGMTTAVTDVVAPADVMYFARGNQTNIRIWGEYNSSGVWTARTWGDDGSNKADKLCVRTDQKDGVQIVRGLNRDAANHVSVSRANIKAWGDELQFGTPVPLGADQHHIRGMINGEEFVLVVTDAAVYAIDSDSMDKVIDFQGFTSEDNGVAIIYSSPNTYFSMGRGGWEQLNGRDMVDVGLWRQEGWMSSLQGPIAAAQGHPQHNFCAVNAGPTGYSSVYIYNGGWHPIYRVPRAGVAITALYYDVTPGSAVNRLWIGTDHDLIWIPVPNVLSPYNDSTFPCAFACSYVSSWIDDEARDLVKYFKNLKIFADNLIGTGSYGGTIEWDYQTDNESDSSAWHVGTGSFTDSPADEVTLGLTCKRMRFRLRIYANYPVGYIPRILATVLGLVTNIPPKWVCTLTFQITEEDGVGQDLTGDEDGQSYDGIVDQLDAWAASPTPVLVESTNPDLHGRYMFVMPAQRRPISYVGGEQSTFVGTLRLQEA